MRKFVTVVLLSFLVTPLLASAQSITITTPNGTLVEVELSHIGPAGNLITPPPLPRAEAFRPPSIFSAPLPSGSGARALGLGGAFTAIADDATAASWNPAGLIQLEVPEASFVYRFSKEKHERSLDSTTLEVFPNEFSNENLNYLSLVLPFHVSDRRMVFSLNYQEAYDFQQEFAAQSFESSKDSNARTKQEAFSETNTEHIDLETLDLDVSTFLTTRTTTSFRQTSRSETEGTIDFSQEGVISSLSPAFAFELNQTVALGGTFNYFMDGEDINSPIKARTFSSFSGRSTSMTLIQNEQHTTGEYQVDGTATIPASAFGPELSFPLPPFRDEINPFSTTTNSTRNNTLRFDGTFEEVNTIKDLRGYNGTLGVMIRMLERLGFGASVDLPWQAEGTQTRSTTTIINTYNGSSQTPLEVSENKETNSKEITFYFPLQWAAGFVWNWNNHFHTSIDASQTLWSDFAFKAEGEEKINPLTGAPHAVSPLDDTWSVRWGSEYLWILDFTEIPFRVGVNWEQRPAIGTSDEYWSFSGGTGFSIGKGRFKTIVDFAYIYLIGNDVTGNVLPEQNTLTTDFEEHQAFVSCIMHF